MVRHYTLSSEDPLHIEGKRATPGPEFFGQFYALTKVINKALS